MRFPMMFILVAQMSGGFFATSAAVEEAGSCGKRKGDVAIAACSRLIKGNPKNVFAFVSRGNAYRDKGDLDHAISDYSEAIRLNPKYALAFLNRGNGYRAKGDPDRAISDYNEAIRLDPKYAFAFNNRGNAYCDKKDLARAISDYNEALRLDPKYGLAFYNRGNAYLAKNEADRAIVDFNEAIRLDSHNPIFLLGRATYYVRLANLDAAIGDLNEAIAFNPKLAAAYRMRGNAYRAERKFDHAIADYDQLLRIDPHDSRVLIDRTLALDAKGDNIQSDQDYRRVLVARLTISKRYPREALQRREEGLVRIAFSIDREGKVASARLESSSGSAALDKEALAMVDRAQPFPPLPDQSKDQARFILPISFRLSLADEGN